jgi:hypothetical protein
VTVEIPGCDSSAEKMINACDPSTALKTDRPRPREHRYTA